jgi:hypothetical protein
VMWLHNLDPFARHVAQNDITGQVSPACR